MLFRIIGSLILAIAGLVVIIGIGLMSGIQVNLVPIVVKLNESQSIIEITSDTINYIIVIFVLAWLFNVSWNLLRHTTYEPQFTEDGYYIGEGIDES